MDPRREVRRFFPLTSLQIGDMQSYLSHITLFLALESSKFLILVDNKPWVLDHDKGSTHLWQLLVNKSRLSPFANTRAKCRRQASGKVSLRNSSRLKFEERRKWFSLVDYQKSTPVKKLKDSWFLRDDLQQILFGYIVFEVSWDQVRGINYLNELQVETSMVVEAKLMKRWEFDSINQASKCMSSWFSATSYERCLLQDYLDNMAAEIFYDAHEGISTSSSSNWEKKNKKFETAQARFSHGDDICPQINELCNEVGSYHTPPPSIGSYKRRRIMKNANGDSDTEESSSEAYGEIISSPSHSMVTESYYSEIISSPNHSTATESSCNNDNEMTGANFEPTYYKDVIVLFRFDDPYLPFELRKIIVSDLRLLRLLEYGLPSWVIFLQSYPVFCRLYRPWMCSFARILYVLVSIFTVLVGFYDLYKNVPVLKAAASRLCGPFFEWVESWEMASRIKCLGTVLFLHHFEKAVAWFLTISRAIRSLILVVTKPMAGPLLELMEFLLPLWNFCAELMETLHWGMFSVMGSTCDFAVGVFNIVLWPFKTIVTVAWTVVTCFVYPLFWILREILVAPIRIIVALVDSILLSFSYISNVLRGLWSSIRGILKLASATKVAVEASEVSSWRNLWDDIFSQVLYAIRSILYGFIAFCTACNRHRLSIYNHLRELFSRTPHDRLTHANSSQLQKNRALILAEKKPSTPRRHHNKHYKKKLA